MTIPISTTLTQIREKVRKVTGSPSQFQISDAQIDDYINTFYLYDLPEHLRILKLKNVYEFFTKPNVESYDLPDESIITVEPPVYVGGYQARYLQDRQAFFQRWPPLNQYQQIGIGTGATSAPILANITAVPIIRGSLYISAIVNGQTITYQDDGEGHFKSEEFAITNITQANPAVVTCLGHPFVNGQMVEITGVIGMLGINKIIGPVTLVVPGVSFAVGINTLAFAQYAGKGFATRVTTVVPPVPVGAINYTTGAISLDWGVIPDTSSIIQAQSIFYTAGRPYDVLFYNSQFHFRPIPDKAYKVAINAYVQPTSLFADPETQAPAQREWWQLIAYGAAMKIFADRADFESLQNFEPLFEEQKLLSQRRTLKQISNQRANTIYESQGMNPSSNFYPYS
jgi:hypothetical protein